MYAEDFKKEYVPERRGFKNIAWLLTAALLTVFLWQIPFGHLMLYPFTILATWFHEMGHGLTALLMGQSFKQLLIFPNGSGIAYHTAGGRLTGALVAAGGLLGPPIAGCLFILNSTSIKRSRFFLGFLGIFLLVSTVIWVRTSFGWVILPLLGVSMLGIAAKGPGWLQQIVIQFLGVQACVSTYRQLDYLFMESANVGGRQMLSDTGHMAEALLLPYWIWGSIIAGASFLLLALSLWHVARTPVPLPPRR